MGINMTFPFNSFLVYLFFNVALSYDFVVVEPQRDYSNLERNVTVKIYNELEDIDGLIVSLGSPKYEIGRGFLVVPETSAGMPTVTGLEG
ncbi:hypothetical protein NQ315_003444 [Exocentrus adspersus]|uniref:Uncharacterized protein n=1 Tax=Exocentrus adspersus TaxID=1586481 RepID=A0AAV8VNI2_9CUCU|nr:hypothetical protein NQ315_003444 [Exocentrus adspersus]